MIFGAIIKVKCLKPTFEIRLFNTYQRKQEDKTEKFILDTLNPNEEMISCTPMNMKVTFVGDHLEIDQYKHWCNIFIECICEDFFISKRELLSTNRKRMFCDIRSIAYMVIHENTPLTLSMIGQMFGKRDHSTIINGLRKGQNLLDTDVEFYSKYQKCVTLFTEIKMSNHD